MTPRTRLAAASLVALAALASSCSTDPSDGASSGGSSSSDEEPSGGRVAAESAPGSLAFEQGAEDAAALDTASVDAASVDPASVDTDRKVISTGAVSLRADDVAEARLAVQEVVDRHGGEVAEEQTATDDDGEAKRARLVLRVPSARFADAVESLRGVAELVDARTTSEDVTTEVLDVGIRVRVQRRSIRRIELLLDRATSIRDIVAIEAQLSRRQADLASLERRQEHLADQTSMSTVTVSIVRAEEERRTDPEDDAGFLSGLSAGWDGLVATALAAATVLGAVLPFAVVGLLLGIPAWALLRRLRRRSALPAE